MKRKILLFPILISSLGVAFSINQHIYRVDAVDNDKLIYIDFSNNVDMVDNPYIAANDKNYSLSLFKEHVYVTDEALSSGLNIDIYSNNEVKTTSFTIRDGFYNYVSISEDGLSINSDGYYRERTKAPDDAYWPTQRVWLYDNTVNPTYDNVVGYYEDGVFKVITMKSVQNTYDQKYYYYMDIPRYVASIHFLKMKDYMIIQDNLISGLMYGTCYQYVDNDVTTMIVDGADSNILARVIEAYLTYGKDESNGAVKSTMKNVYGTWFSNRSATDDDLKSTKILDYTGYAANGNKYEGLEPEKKSAPYSVNEKWNTICSQAGIDPKTGQDRSTFVFPEISNLVWYLLIGVIALVPIIIFTIVLIKKKKNA